MRIGMEKPKFKDLLDHKISARGHFFGVQPRLFEPSISLGLMP